MWYLSSEIAAESQLLSPLGACQQILNFSENYGFIGKKIQSCHSAALLHHSFLCSSLSLSLQQAVCASSFTYEKSRTWILLTDLSLSATQARVFLLAGFAYQML
jgi:hypothetical protein